jgi:pyridoxal phosphate enzyme (YggS family)
MLEIKNNLESVRQRIAASCSACGRDPAQVGLLAVSKTFGPEAVAQAYAAGQLAFGENYIQEAVEKIQALAHLPLQWHCIGPVQSNKTRLVAEHFDWVQSIDRLKIAERLSAQRPTARGPLQVCIQVNLDGRGAEQIGRGCAGGACPGAGGSRSAGFAIARHHDYPGAGRQRAGHIRGAPQS